MPVQAVHQQVDRPRVEQGVVIQQQDIATATSADPQVVAAGDAKVLRAAYQLHLWKALFQRVGRAILGGIIDQHHFEAGLGWGCIQRLQALGGVVELVVVDQDDGYVRLYGYDSQPPGGNISPVPRQPTARRMRCAGNR